MPPTLTLSSWFKDNAKAAAKARTFLYQGGSTRDCVEMLRAKYSYPFGDHTALWAWALRNYPDDYVSRERKAAERFFVSDQQVKALARTADIFVTCAVNNAPVCKPALIALEKAAHDCRGAVAVLPIRYKNPTRRGEIPEDEWWAAEVRPYLIENEVRPHPLLSILTRKVQATSNNPLPARFSSMTQDRSAITGHPQLMLRTVATPQNALPKVLFSSGAITEAAYSDTDAGQLAEFHHSIAAVKIEVRGNRFHLRDMTWDGNCWLDGDRAYTPRGVRRAPPVSALIMGDIHVGLVDPGVEAATFGPGGLVEFLRPELIVLHDLFDGKSVNPHDRNRALTEAVQARLRVQDELAAVRDWLESIPASVKRVAVVASNHDEFLHRWLDLGRPPNPADARLFHQLSDAMIGGFEETGQFPNALELGIRKVGGVSPRVEFLRKGQPLVVCDVSLENHGHKGTNGSKGSVQNLAQLGVKTVSGHNHTPTIYQGARSAGLSAVYDHGYNWGLSSWLHCHVAVNANGTRQMWIIVNGKARG